MNSSFVKRIFAWAFVSALVCTKIKDRVCLCWFKANKC